MPYWIDLMTSDVRKSSHFYGELLGWDFEELYVGYRVARVQGLLVVAIVDKPEDSPLPDTWVTYFLGDDIEALAFLEVGEDFPFGQLVKRDADQRDQQVGGFFGKGGRHLVEAA